MLSNCFANVCVSVHSVHHPPNSLKWWKPKEENIVRVSTTVYQCTKTTKSNNHPAETIHLEIQHTAPRHVLSFPTFSFARRLWQFARLIIATCFHPTVLRTINACLEWISSDQGADKKRRKPSKAKGRRPNIGDNLYPRHPTAIPKGKASTSTLLS